MLLYAPEYKPNLSNMVRSCEFFGLKKVYIFDQNKLLEASTKQERADLNHMARVWTAGAIDHIDIEIITDLVPFFQQYKGRKIATVLDNRATDIHQFSFQPNDLLIMGPEKNGLPYSVRALTEEKIVLTSAGNTDCLNVSVFLGICLFYAQNQLK